jgi:D-glycero-D-manno-heptose 1,7-bisphosphate phosphatase
MTHPPKPFEPPSFPAVLLDRDGALNRDRDDFVRTLDDFEVFPQAMRAIAAFARSGLKVAVVSNQSGIARGYLTAETLDAMTEKLRTAAAAAGGRIDGAYHCPHGPDDGCECRKPLAGLLHRAAADLRLDLSRSVMVGDSERDLAAGAAAGCRAAVLVLTGKTPPEKASSALSWMTPPDFIAPTLEEAVPWIVRKIEERVESGSDVEPLPAGSCRG